MNHKNKRLLNKLLRRLVGSMNIRLTNCAIRSAPSWRTCRQKSSKKSLASNTLADRNQTSST